MSRSGSKPHMRGSEGLRNVNVRSKSVATVCPEICKGYLAGPGRRVRIRPCVRWISHTVCGYVATCSVQENERQKANLTCTCRCVRQRRRRSISCAPLPTHVSQAGSSSPVSWRPHILPISLDEVVSNRFRMTEYRPRSTSGTSPIPAFFDNKYFVSQNIATLWRFRIGTRIVSPGFGSDSSATWQVVRRMRWNG